MEDIADKTKENEYNLNFTAHLKLYKDILSVKGVYGMNQESMRRSIFIPSDVYFSRMYKSRGNIQSERRLTQTLEAMLTFSKYMFNTVQIDALAGIGKYLKVTKDTAFPMKMYTMPSTNTTSVPQRASFIRHRTPQRMKRDRSSLKRALTYWTSM